MSDKADIPETHGDDDALAAEYVLGVLSAEERRHCAERITDEPAFARLVAAWESRLAGLNNEFDEVPPPSKAKAALDGRLFGAESAPVKPGLWTNLAFWRGLSAAAILAVVALVTVNLTDTVAPGEQLIAALAPNDSDARFVVLYSTATRDLRVSRLAGDKPTDRDFEPWLIARDVPPASLGLIEGDAAGAPSVAVELQDAFLEGATLAVSVEPRGGSKTGAPTGPVVALGKVNKI